MSQSIVMEKSFAFALRIIKLCQFLNQKYELDKNVLSKQLLRSGTSTGANVEEAQAGQSKTDFISKMSIDLKEASETNDWLRPIEGGDMVNSGKNRGNYKRIR